MVAIKGVYDKGKITPLEKIRFPKRCMVIITFLEEESPIEDKKRSRETTESFLKRCSGWEDERTPEEIIEDIYSTRTVSRRGENIFSRRRDYSICRPLFYKTLH
ncbi:MAG: hypothetical protein AB1422_04425 [bacterium]